MKNASKSIVDQVLQLPAVERLRLAEQLLSSLEQPAEEMDTLWATEAEERIDAYDRGESDVVSVNEVLGKYDET